MPAQKPEDCDILLMETMNRGDLEAAVDLYEPTAVLVQDPSGQTINGHEAIREFIRGGLAAGLRMTRETHVLQNGDLALTGGRWKLTGTDADGKPVAYSGNSTEVVRRQPDGTWRFAIDNPWGAGLE